MVVLVIIGSIITGFYGELVYALISYERLYSPVHWILEMVLFTILWISCIGGIIWIGRKLLKWKP